MITTIRKYWRQAFCGVVLFVAWTAFLNTKMPGEDSPAKYFKALYLSVTLFVLGGVDATFPKDGPTPALAVLWICYMLAPLLTVSYVYTVIEERLLNKLPYHLKNHNVILGMGRNGMFMYEMIKHSNPREKNVIIDRNLLNPNFTLYEHDKSVWWIRKDFEVDVVLRKAVVHKARRIFITTNNDLVNLNTMVKCIALNPGVEKIFCHLQDYAMHKNFSESLKRIPEYQKVVVFNAYKSASKEILKLIKVQNDTNSISGNIFMLFGFGHFGQTLFDDLIINENTSENDEIVIATLKTKLFFDITKYDWANKKFKTKILVHPPFYKDIYSAELWDDINKVTKGKNKQIIIINCLDNDEANISLAVQMKNNGPDIIKKSIFYCRVFKPLPKELEDILISNITESDSKDIVMLSLETALQKAYNDLLI